MHRSRLRPGDSIVVKKSWSSDVQPGSKGTIVDAMPGGYAVNITGVFPTHWGGELLRRGAFFFASARFSVWSPSAFPAIFPPPLRKGRFRCCSLLPLSLPTAARGPSARFKNDKQDDRNNGKVKWPYDSPIRGRCGCHSHSY